MIATEIGYNMTEEDEYSIEMEQQDTRAIEVAERAVETIDGTDWGATTEIAEEEEADLVIETREVVGRVLVVESPLYP